MRLSEMLKLNDLGKHYGYMTDKRIRDLAIELLYYHPKIGVAFRGVMIRGEVKIEVILFYHHILFDLHEVPKTPEYQGFIIAAHSYNEKKALHAVLKKALEHMELITRPIQPERVKLIYLFNHIRRRKIRTQILREAMIKARASVPRLEDIP